MKISIDVDPEKQDTEVHITCPSLTPEIERVISLIRAMDSKLTVKKNSEVYILDLNKVLYLEAVERKCFVYTLSEVYESDSKMVELEDLLVASGFFRISKSCMVNLKRIKSLRTDINHRIRITMDNEEQLVASRMYADELRVKLGLK